MKVVKTIEMDGRKYDLVRSDHDLKHPCRKCAFKDSDLCGVSYLLADCIVDEYRTYFVPHRESAGQGAGS